MAYIFEAAQRLPLSAPDSGRSALTEGAQLIDLRGSLTVTISALRLRVGAAGDTSRWPIPDEGVSWLPR